VIGPTKLVEEERTRMAEETNEEVLQPRQKLNSSGSGNQRKKTFVALYEAIDRISKKSTRVPRSAEPKWGTAFIWHRRRIQKNHTLRGNQIARAI
jgi:hypothetical protein